MACGIAETGTAGPPISSRTPGQARRPASRSDHSSPSGPGPSKKTGPMTCRLPAATAPRWVASWWKYMSSWVVHPPRSDSSAPRVAPSSTVAGSMTAPSACQTRARKPWRSTSSARPRSSVIGRCVWRLTSPGIASLPRPSRCSVAVAARVGRGRAARLPALRLLCARLGSDGGDDAVLDGDRLVREDRVGVVDGDEEGEVGDDDSAHAADPSSSSVRVALVWTSSSRTASTSAAEVFSTASISSIVMGSSESPTPEAGLTTREIAA